MTERPTITVYLDTALVRNLQKKRVDSALAVRLRSPFVRLVFSSAHIDDVVSADAATDQQMRDEIFHTPNALLGLPGLLVPTVELTALVGQNPSPPAPPRVLFPTLDAMQAAYPDLFEVRDLRGEYQPWADIRTVRSEQKDLWAEAETQGRAARSDKCSPTDSAWVRAFLAGDPAQRSQTDEERWQAYRAECLAGIDEEVPRLIPEQLEAAAGQIPGLDPASVRLMAETANRHIEALIADDRDAILHLADVAQSLDSDFQTALDPLGLGTSTRKHFFFTHFLGWLPVAERADLLSDRPRLEYVFRQWLKSTDSCPGGLVYREAKWQLMNDPRMPITASTEPDFHHLVLLPYVDVFFADKRTAHALDTAPGIPDALKNRCIRNGNFEVWLRGLGS